MFTRISSVAGMVLVLSLASACGSGEPSESAFAVKADSAITCAVDGATSFEDSCTIERSTSDIGLILTIRHPSGGFRRLLVTKDGRGVVAADGAEAAVVAPLGTGTIEVTIDRDRYRLPATIKAAEKTQ